MTATRWWVRLFARWQARIDSVKGQIQALSLAVTAFSTFSLLLQNAGFGAWVPYLGAVGAVGLPAYAYLFFEGGVWNQVNRDRVDRSDNFIGPGGYIAATIQARAFAEALAAAERGEDPDAAAAATVEELWREYRDGVDIDALEVDR